MKGIILLLILPFVVKAAGAAEPEPANFIESVHTQGAELAKEMIIEGNQVVWSPYSVVNVLPLINGDTSLQESFKTSLDYIQDLEGLKVKRLSAVYYLDNTTVESVAEIAKNYAVHVIPRVAEDGQLKQVLAENFKDAIGDDVPEGFLPESFESTNQLYMTSLLLKGVWDTPFRYAPKNRFYLNETNAVKTKYMTNIGFFRYGDIDGVDAKILALPLKNTSTTYFLIVLPNNFSSLPDVSEQFGKVQIGNILQSLKIARTQLVIPKLDIDSQLVLQPKPHIKILQSGSIRLTYTGFDHRASKHKKSYHKHLRTRVNKKDVKFIVNHPFLFVVYDTEVGVLSYGEVLIPTTDSASPIRLKSESDAEGKLTQNAKSLVDYYNEVGGNLYQNMRTGREGNFVIAPVAMAHLLASYSLGASVKVQHELFSTLNSKDGMLEVWRNVQYFNGTSSNCSTIVGGDEGFEKKVQGLGTKVVVEESERTQGYYNYTFQTKLRSTKRFQKTFYLNERDSVNSTFYEYIGKIKYVGLPYWDAKAIQVYVSPSQSLLIFTPNERSGLHLVEEGLRDFSVSKLLCQMSDRFVRLRLPAFEVEYISDVYPELKDALSVDQLRFEGIGDSLLESIVQNVTISVRGSEDAKAKHKVRGRGTKSKTRKPNTRFNLDRPFIFYLLDNTVGSLAIGRVVTLPAEVVLGPVVSTTTPVAPDSSSSSEAPPVPVVVEEPVSSSTIVSVS